jgi:parallel beta-helix repeat protein
MKYRQTALFALIALLLSVVSFQQSSVIEAQGMIGLTGKAIGPQDKNYTPPAGAYFAAPNGSDTNSGTSADSPWTLAKALKDAPKSATIVLRGGTYAMGDFVINKNYTIQPYQSEKPVLEGGEVVTNWTADGDDWMTNWEYLFPKVTNPDDYTQDEARNDKDRVWINNEIMKRVATRNEVEPGKFFVDYGAKKVYIGTNPSGKTVVLTRRRFGLMRVYWNIGGVPNGSEERGLTVKGIKFQHYAQNGIWMRTGDLKLENNVFTRMSDGGLLTYNTNHIIRNNEFSFNGMQGLHIGGGHNTVFENNIVRGNRVNDSTDHEPRGLKYGSSDFTVTRNNLFEDNDANGVWHDVGSDDATIVQNIVRNNKDLGIHFEISNRAIIAGNLVTGNKIGIYVQISSNAKVYNNTLANNGQPIHILEWVRTDADSNQGPGKTENTEVKNNIFFNATNTDWPWALLTVRSADEMCDQPLVSKLNYNAYFRAVGTQPNFLIRWDPVPNCSDKTYTTLAAFESEVGFEKNGLDLAGPDDPFFVNASGGDYSLKNGSPAIGAGDSLPNGVAAALGWAAGVATDLGAIQVNSPDTQPTDSPTGEPTAQPTGDPTNQPTPDPDANLLVNGGFEQAQPESKRLALGWKLSGGLSKRVCNKVDRPGKPDKIVAHEENCGYQLTAGKLSQKITPSGLGNGQSLSFEGYVQGKGVSGAKVVVKAKYTDLTSDKLDVSISTGAYAYGEVTGSLPLTATVAKIKVQLVYSGSTGKALVDALELKVQGGTRGSEGLIPLP